MTRLESTVRQSLKHSGGAMAAFASSTWTLGWCYATSAHSPTSALVGLPVLLAGIAALGRIKPHR